MIWDCIMFNGEADVLYQRMLALDGYDMRHVIVEASVTHTGHGKQLIYPLIEGVFNQWAHKISYVAVESVPDSLNPWDREHYQRDQALPMLEFADPNDLILISDADEFPSAAALAWDGEFASVLNQRMAMYAVDWLYPERHLTSVIARYWHVKNMGSLAKVRDNRYLLPVEEDGGWHLTWLGGVKKQREKLANSCEYGQPHAAGKMTPYEASLISKGRCYREGIHHSGKLRMIPVDVDDTWPGDPASYPASWFRPRGAA